MKARLADRRRAGGEPPPLWLGRLPRLAARAGLPAWPLDVVLVDDDEMAAVNRAWRGQDEPTDVISFSYLQRTGTAAPALSAGAGCAAADLWRGPGDDAEGAPVGEIVLAPAFIDARCAANGWDREAEWALLAAHGMLHVLGWEHDDAAQAAAMRSLEADLLRTEGLTHPLAGTPAPSGEGSDDGAGR